MKTVILTDSCCDLPISYVKENDIKVLSIRVSIDKEEFHDDLGQSLGYHEFYEKIRSGKMPTTSQVTSYTFEEAFRGEVEKGNSVLYIGFSSALSGCVNSARVAKKTIEEEFKEADITVIDSLCASLGLGLLVYYAIEMRNNNKSKEEMVSWIEENKLKLNHWFTVDDLNHLQRGGRVSKAVAAFGTILSIKPIMHVDNEGRLIPLAKVKGRKKSIRTLMEHMKEKAINPEEQVVFISHGDCEEEAIWLKKLIIEELKVKDVLINPIGVAVGSHSGPGTMALFFMGKDR